ncbi:MAG: DUF4867 family protein [Veillonellaceae bacterium]|nr:DUF4867 family protein [Veillonellaceae bacterium]
MSDILSQLRAANPALNLLSVAAVEFGRYGRLLARYDAGEMIARAQAIVPETDGVAYEPSVPALEQPSALNEQLAREVYGGMPIQVGWCYGANLQMAGLEYHKGTEIDVCLTDQILLVGHVGDICYGQEISYDTRKVAAFFAPAGSVLELPAWNLHFAPAHVRTGGRFATLVYLPRGTNEDLPFQVPPIGENKLLFAVNKWLLVHPGATALVQQGAYPGLKGDDIFVKPV